MSLKWHDIQIIYKRHMFYVSFLFYFTMKHLNSAPPTLLNKSQPMNKGEITTTTCCV